ncbi:MAG: glycosyltransferase family 87 protein [Candidatus Dormiibacterota bacterium]
MTVPQLLSPAPSSLTNLDPSWQESLGVAILDHLQFGPQYLWTYGPLGFLHDSFVYPSETLTNATAAVNILERVVYVVTFLFFGDFIRRANRVGRGGDVVLLIATALVAYLSATTFDFGDIAVMLSLFAAAACLCRPAQRTAPYLAAGSGALLGLAALYKADLIWAGMAQLLLMSVVFLLGGQRLRAAVAPAWIAMAGMFAVGWVATGQHLANIGSFIVGSWEISAGYSANMSIGNDWHRPVVVGAVAILALASPLALARWRGRWRPSPQISGVVLAGPFLVVSWKEAVVRMEGRGLADPRAVSLYLTVVAVAWFVLLLSHPLFSWRTVGPALATVVCAAITLGGVWPFGAEPWVIAQVLPHSGPSRSSIGASTPAYDTIPAEAIALLRGHTATAIPWDVDLIVDHHLRWDPLPVPQTYAAYTSYLDHLESAQLNSRRGAQRVVTSFLDIDGRYEVWDPPLLWQSLLTRYSCEATTGISAVLRKTSRKAGADHLIQKTGTAFGRWVAVPRTKYPVELVRLSVNSSLEGQTLGLVLRQAPVLVEFRLSNGLVTPPLRFEASDALDGEYVSHYLTRPGALCDVLSGHGGRLPSIVDMKFSSTHASEWKSGIGVQFVGRS